MKTKAQILLFVLCFFVTKSKAQVYFNNQYDATGNFDGTNSIDTFQNKYLTIGIEGVFGSHWGLSNYLLNQDGTIFKKTTYGFQGDNLLPNNGKYIRMGNQFYSCGMWAYGGYKSKAFLWRFNANLDSVKYTSYGFINQTNVVTSFIKHTDNKIYMVGYVDDTLQTNSDILLIKTDTAGNEIWKKKIGLTSWDETAISIDTLQGQLIIAGYKTPHGSWSPLGFVMRLDTAGNVIWNKTVNTNSGGGCGAKTLKDGNILVYGQYKQYSIGSDDYYRLQVEKITPNNVSLWSYKYNAPTISAGPSAAIENKHGNIVIVGQQCYTPGLYVNGVVNEIAQNGDSIFSREYFKMGGSQNYFRDVVQTNDGGYCFAGFIIPVPANGGTGTEDIWLLKVDSNFCESATPCGYGVGLAPLSFGEGLGVRLYPNPANDVLNIEFSTTLELKEQTITIELTNALGQVVLNETSIAQNLKLKTNNLQSGLYYLSIKTKDKIVTRKIMIKK
jgi:hypothetical protein